MSNLSVFKTALRENGTISQVDAILSFGITSDAAIVSRLRKIYGRNSIRTTTAEYTTTSGKKFRCRAYTLTAEGRSKMWPVKKAWPLIDQIQKTV